MSNWMIISFQLERLISLTLYSHPAVALYCKKWNETDIGITRIRKLNITPNLKGLISLSFQNVPSSTVLHWKKETNRHWHYKDHKTEYNPYLDQNSFLALKDQCLESFSPSKNFYLFILLIAKQKKILASSCRLGEKRREGMWAEAYYNPAVLTAHIKEVPKS